MTTPNDLQKRAEIRMQQLAQAGYGEIRIPERGRSRMSLFLTVSPDLLVHYFKWPSPDTTKTETAGHLRLQATDLLIRLPSLALAEALGDVWDRGWDEAPPAPYKGRIFRMSSSRKPGAPEPLTLAEVECLFDRLALLIQGLIKRDWDSDDIVLVLRAIEEHGEAELSGPSAALDALTETIQRVQANTLRSQATAPVTTADVQALVKMVTSASSVNPSDAVGRAVAQYRRSPGRIGEDADLLKAIAKTPDLPTVPPDDPDLVDNVVLEGRARLVAHLVRERNQGLRRQAIQAALDDQRRLACEVCSTEMENVYGEHGRGFIEVHHRVPLAQTGERHVSIADLALVCPNCHRMLHRGQPLPTVELLSEIIHQRRLGNS